MAYYSILLKTKKKKKMKMQYTLKCLKVVFILKNLNTLDFKKIMLTKKRTLNWSFLNAALFDYC